MRLKLGIFRPSTESWHSCQTREKTVNQSTLSKQQKIQGAAAAVIALAAFLPWASIFGISANGISGDGQITLVVALVALAALATQTGLTGDFTLSRKLVLTAAILCAGVATLVGLFDMNEFAAIGLYLTLLAGIVMAAAIVWELRLGAPDATDAASSPEASDTST